MSGMTTLFRTVAVIAMLCAGTLQPASGQAVSVVVSTSMLETAVREVVPASAPIEVVSILPPSSCPGHFDLSPRVIPLLRTAALVIRHDYQGVLDDKIAQRGGDIRAMYVIPTTGSPLIPENYFRLATEIAVLMVKLVPGMEPEIRGALGEMNKQAERLGAETEPMKEPWRGVPVIASTNAVELCEWLGFTVAGELPRSEDVTPKDFEALMRLDVDMIVGNYQEGTQSAESLGEKMKVPVAVISNFPGLEGFGETYQDLFTANLKQIDGAWRKR